MCGWRVYLTLPMFKIPKMVVISAYVPEKVILHTQEILMVVNFSSELCL